MLATELLGCRKTGRAPTRNHDVLRPFAYCCLAALTLRRFLFMLYKDPTVPVFHRPARHRTQGRGAHGFSRPETEAGVMPRAAHRIIDHESVRERSAVMRAIGADREELITPARKQYGLLAHVSRKHAAIGEIINGDADCKIEAWRV